MVKMKKEITKKKAAKIRNYLLLIIGIYLFADGLLSILIATPASCYSACLNNSLPGQAGRILRALIGVFLIYESFQRKRFT